MTNTIALCLALLILTVFAVDGLLLQGTLPVFLGKQFATLVEYLSFWR